MTTFIDAFVSGYKPAIWLLYPDENKQIEQLKHKYPYLTSNRKKHAISQEYIDYWFFKDEATKAKCDKNRLVERRNKGLQCDGLIGKMLGFPPAAVSNFARLRKDRTCGLNETKMGVDYAGIRFMSYESSILHDLNWLRVNNPIPEHIDAYITVDFYGKDLNNKYISDSFAAINKIIEQVERLLQQNKLIAIK